MRRAVSPDTAARIFLWHACDRKATVRRAAPPTIDAMHLGGLTRVHGHSYHHHHSYGSGSGSGGGSGGLSTVFVVLLVIVAVVALAVWAGKRRGGDS